MWPIGVFHSLCRFYFICFFIKIEHQALCISDKSETNQISLCRVYRIGYESKQTPRIEQQRATDRDSKIENGDKHKRYTNIPFAFNTIYTQQQQQNKNRSVSYKNRYVIFFLTFLWFYFDSLVYRLIVFGVFLLFCCCSS